jgi:hypothetical protein
MRANGRICIVIVELAMSQVSGYGKISLNDKVEAT